MGWDDGLVNSMADKEAANLSGGRVLTYGEAVREALVLAMGQDPDVFILGQGVDDPSGYWGITKDLDKQFGSDRVFDTPLSEEAMTGVSIGASMMGKRPILFHNRPDFILLSMNQLVSHAAKIPFMDNGKSKVPLVIWSAIGRGWGSGAQHSQTVHSMLLGVPNLKLVLPSTPYDAKGLLLEALKDDGPVLIFEHRWTMRHKGVVPEGYYRIPFGLAVHRRWGTDLTIVGTSHAIDLAIQAADSLSTKFSCEVIDLRTIKPLDTDAIFSSGLKTGRVLAVDTGPEVGGICAEIGALLANEVISFERLAMPDIPNPAGQVLENLVYPSIEKIKQKIEAMCVTN